MLTWSTHPFWVYSNLSPRGGRSAPYRASHERRGRVSGSDRGGGPAHRYGPPEGVPVSELNAPADRADPTDGLDALLGQPGVQSDGPGRVASRNEVPGRHMPTANARTSPPTAASSRGIPPA